MGALPVLSFDGHQSCIVAYDYDNNFIKAQEVSDLNSFGVNCSEAFSKKTGVPVLLNALNSTG